MEGHFLTVNELAEKLKVPVSWVYSQTRQKDSMTIPKIKVGKYIRFQMNDVMEWLEKKQTIGR